MLNCKEIIRLCSENLDHGLSVWQRVNLRLHLMMCRGCSAYKRQLEGLHRLFGSLRRRTDDVMPLDSAVRDRKLSAERRERIEHLLKSKDTGSRR